jgi:hypothetical protein
MYRNEKLLKSVRELPCQICGIEDGTIVAAHSNQLRHGKGRSIKAHDWAIAALCYNCHAEIDQGSKLNKSERIENWQSAWEKTIAELFERGIVNVK